MTIAQKSETHPKGGLCTRHSGNSGAAAEIGPWVFVGKTDVGVDLSVTTGNAKVEVTSALPSEVNDGSAVAYDWTPGLQTGAGKKTGVISGATAVRLNMTVVSTVAVMNVRAEL